MNREYGSGLFRLLDAPLNAATMMALKVAAVEALERWEPRIRVSKVNISSAANGSCLLGFLATVVDSGEALAVEGLRVGA
jgi:phage baseplate assembly protein W